MKIKSLILFFILSFSLNSFALTESKWFEPVIGCGLAGAVGYSSGSEDNRMKQAGVACLGAGLIMWVINEHYFRKYGDEFGNEIEYLKNRKRNFKYLKKQTDGGKESLYFKRVKQVLPPKIINGKGVGVRIREKLILKDSLELIGD